MMRSIRSQHAATASSRKATNDKLFGRYDDLVRMVLGFVLTGLIGTYLSHRYTTEQADLSAAGKVFSEHSKLMGDRYFAQAQLTMALHKRALGQELGGGNTVESRLLAYREILQQWNSARGYNREMIKLYFGHRMWGLERDVHYAFRAWGQALEVELTKPGSVDLGCLEGKTDLLLQRSHNLRVLMAEAIQRGDVGSSREKSDAVLNQLPATYCLKQGSSLLH